MVGEDWSPKSVAGEDLSECRVLAEIVMGEDPPECRVPAERVMGEEFAVLKKASDSDWLDCEDSPTSVCTTLGWVDRFLDFLCFNFPMALRLNFGGCGCRER